MNGVPWTDLELSLLYETVNDRDWYEQIAEHIQRSEAAIRTRMSQLRQEAGIVPQHVGSKAASRTHVIADAAAIGSERLRRAIESVAA